ncbi:hypothetical protein [Rhodococcus sp. 105337]|uniref:hypothetical protein n=1 Tax=Rhodococcus sp. 105337 TaxID=2725310 RepID=UPI00146F67AE|nr:hypothetical protein [Rhodococcus sp. 105337]NME78275.1 hypothetical protein [Rhodococcus sp. 105337]
MATEDVPVLWTTFLASPGGPELLVVRAFGESQLFREFTFAEAAPYLLAIRPPTTISATAIFSTLLPLSSFPLPAGLSASMVRETD